MHRETKLMAYFAIALGVAAFALGLHGLSGRSVSIGGLSCKVICGLSLVITELFGPAYGALVASLLWVAIGLVFTFVGVIILRGSRNA